MNFLRNLLRGQKKNIEDLVSSKIIVLGDSHSRGFSLNDNFFPIFIGAGKEHNFIDTTNADRVTDKVLNILNTVQNNKLLFFLGEPDTRYYLGYGWYPWEEEKKVEYDNFEEEVDKSILRYERLLKEVSKRVETQPMVLGVTPSRRVEQNKIVDYFNMKLKELCKRNKYIFLDVNDQIYSYDERIVKDEYYGDPVHLNNRIQVPVENFLVEKGFIKEAKFNSNADFIPKEIQKKYKYDKRFGCYTLD